jgi:hypothetical protein
LEGFYGGGRVVMKTEDTESRMRKLLLAEIEKHARLAIKSKSQLEKSTRELWLKSGETRTFVRNLLKTTSSVEAIVDHLTSDEKFNSRVKEFVEQEIKDRELSEKAKLRQELMDNLNLTEEDIDLLANKDLRDMAKNK